MIVWCDCFFFFQAEDGIRDAQESRGLGDVYKRQEYGDISPVQMEEDDPFFGLGYDAGVFVWRMDGIRPRPLPEQEHGTFRTNSCYIVAECLETPRDFSTKVFSWIGISASVEAKASAALQADHLARSMGASLQREVQYDESMAFAQLWHPMLEYDDTEGGQEKLKSGKREHVPRLFRIKESWDGYLAMLQLPVTSGSLNSQDVFVLDEEQAVFQFNGSGSNAHKRGKAMEVANKIVDSERGGRVRVVVVLSLIHI
eukprot:TRINITY_DN33700_c0_g1_i1.p1 TRINITY_DN33700_c0_g1~~TRINITY_DN33700_c0_g1_i1.p1  ORF type:complete len:256 (-),score=75.29 TRINITY_DN33700_c0_g1_i1:92-859(-)